MTVTKTIGREFLYLAAAAVLAVLVVAALTALAPIRIGSLEFVIKRRMQIEEFFFWVTLVLYGIIGSIRLTIWAVRRRGGVQP